MKKVAADFDVNESRLTNRLTTEDREDGVRLRPNSGKLVQLQGGQERTRLLEQENEVLRRAAAFLSQANPAGTMMYRSPVSWPKTGSPSR